MKHYATAAMDHEGDEITARRSHDTLREARDWMQDKSKDADYWDQLGERDGYHKEVASISLFADGEEVDFILADF